MSNITADRRVEDDWWKEPIPLNVFGRRRLYRNCAELSLMRSKREQTIELGDHVSCTGVSFALGEHGSCKIGDFSLVNGVMIMANERIEIGKHCLISWNVGIADSDFHPLTRSAHRHHGARTLYKDRPPRPPIKAVPVTSDSVWIGMNAVILKGVTIGENSVVAAGGRVEKRTRQRRGGGQSRQ